MPDGLFLYKNEKVESQYFVNSLTLGKLMPFVFMHIADGSILYAACLTIYEEIADPKKEYNINIDEEEVVQVFMPKALVLLSSYPYFETFRQILLCIHKHSTNSQSSISIERLIDYYLCETPMPQYQASL